MSDVNLGKAFVYISAIAGFYHYGKVIRNYLENKTECYRAIKYKELSFYETDYSKINSIKKSNKLVMRYKIACFVENNVVWIFNTVYYSLLFILAVGLYASLGGGFSGGTGDYEGEY